MPSTRLQLRVSPGASHSSVVGRYAPAAQRPGWKVRVAAPPEDGKANDAVVRLLASTLGLAQRDVTIVAGHAARDKVATVAGLEPEETDRRLALAAQSESHMSENHLPGKDAT